MRFRKDLGDLTELKNSIKKIGLIHPIVKDSKGNLICGERRLRACQELGIEPIYRIVDFENPQKAEIDENVCRKDFTPIEKYEIGKWYNKTLSKQYDGVNQYSEKRVGVNDANPKQPRDIVADITGTSVKTLSKINKIFDSTDDKLKQDVDNGKISIDKGYKIVVKEEKKQEKLNQLNEVSKTFSSDNIKSYYGDFYEFSKGLDDNSLDCILTDPPYPEEYLPLWEQLFEVAYQKLKPSKFLVAYSGEQHLDKIFRLHNDLIYYWMFKLDFSTTQLVMGRNIISTWKPVLVFQKPPFKKIEETISDKVSEITKFNYDDRTLHNENWGQAIGNFEYLIDKFTQPGDLIFEPFTGTGTTLVAAQRMKRRCIGVELDEISYRSIIEGRLVQNQ